MVWWKILEITSRLKMIILKWILKATESEGVDRTDLVQNRKESRDLVHIVIHLLDS
jgi:hypothetical protein